MRSLVLVALLSVFVFVPSARADDAAPVRVATLVPWVHDLVALAPERATIVASTRSLRHGTTAGDDRVDLGSPHAPSLEALASARADVVVYDEAMHARSVTKLRALAGRAVGVRTDDVDATLEAIETVGRALDLGDVAAARVAELRESINRSDLGRDVSAVTLYASPGAPVVVTERTWLGDLLGRLGVVNAAAAVSGREGYPGYVTPSEETIATLRADWILLVVHGSGEDALRALRRRMEAESVWRGLRESVGDRILVLDQELFGSNPGVRLDEAAAWVHERLGEGRP